MISSPVARIVFIFAVVAISTTSAGSLPHKNGQKACERVLATSTLVRGTSGRNEDAYLAELTITREGDPLLGRLADSYPNEPQPSSRVELTSALGTTFKVRPETNCKLPYGQMNLRMAPGGSDGHTSVESYIRPKLDKVPDAGAVVPRNEVER